jgi:hypothetical protein
MPGTTEDMSITQGSIGLNVPGRCRDEVLVDGDPPAALGDPSRLGRRLRAVLAVVIIADILDLMDTTITNIAAPTIVRDIGGGESLIKWLGASYSPLVCCSWSGVGSVTATDNAGCSSSASQASPSPLSVAASLSTPPC